MMALRTMLNRQNYLKEVHLALSYSCQQVGIWINNSTTLASSLVWLIPPAVQHLKAEINDESVLMKIHAAILILLVIAFIVSAAFTVRLAYVCTNSVPTDVLVQN